MNPFESSKDPFLPCWPRPGLKQLPKEGTVPALGVRDMAMWTVGTTGQEAQVNLEHRQPDLEGSLQSEIQSFY